VAFGTIIAQIIPIITAPILTRIYAPEDYGTFGLYMSIVSIGVTLASARFDLAIFIPKNLDDSKRIIVLTILISGFFSFFLFLIIVATQHYMDTFFNVKGLGSWVLTIPFIVFVISLYQNYLHWLNRIKNYKGLNFLRILNSLLLSLFNLLWGFFNFKSIGLVLSLMVSYSIMTVLYLKDLKMFLRFTNLNRLRILIRKYKNFPLYSLPSTLSGEIGAQMPTFLLIYYFNEAIAGFYILATRMISLPFSILGNSIATVYRQEAIEEFNLNGNCTVIYIKTFKKLLLISILPVLIIMFGSEWLFSIFFGAKWIVAGKMASYLSFLVFFQLLSTPMADTILFINGQKIDFILQFARLIFSILSFVIGGFLHNYELAIILFTITYSSYYIFHSIIQYKIANGEFYIK
jgi:O-antigen/teichoic acid export membrane protein